MRYKIIPQGYIMDTKTGDFLSLSQVCQLLNTFEQEHPNRKK